MTWQLCVGKTEREHQPIQILQIELEIPAVNTSCLNRINKIGQLLALFSMKGTFCTCKTFKLLWRSNDHFVVEVPIGTHNNL